MKPSSLTIPQKVSIERDSSLGTGGVWQIRVLYRFYGWSWVADVRGYALARKVAALVRRGA